jgi:hypothetical protein
MAAQTEFPTFCEQENGKLFAFYSLYRINLDRLTLSALGWGNLTIFWITLVISLRTL